MKKLYYFIIPALLLGSCQSDPTLETESSPLVRTKVTELQYAQTDKIDVEALNIISPYCISQASGADTYSVSYPACADPTLTDTLKSAFYASNTLAVKPTLERLACANMQTGCLDICEINGNELIRVNEVHLTPAKVKFNRHRPKGRGLVHPVNYSKYHIFGFCDLAVSDDYIYALYSGRTLKQHNLDVDKGKTILVFDWNGSHVRTYRLENACSSISYSAEENTIYALSQENNHSEIITLHL